MSVRFAPQLNERNQAPAGPFDIPVRVEHQHGSTRARVVSLTIEASYDGKTWASAPVRKTRTGWTATLNQPNAGFVSLRAKARDLSGNTVDQTILHAYELTADQPPPPLVPHADQWRPHFPRRAAGSHHRHPLRLIRHRSDLEPADVDTLPASGRIESGVSCCLLA